MEIIKSILNFIKKHPYITVFAIFTIVTFFEGYESRDWNFAGYYFVALCVCAIISPFVRRARERKERREDAEHLARQIALEQDKIKNPDKYNQ